MRGFQCPISYPCVLRGPQTVAHRRDSDEAGEGAVQGHREFLEEIKLFGLEEIWKDVGSVLRLPKIRESGQGLGDPRGQNCDPGLETSGKHS